MKKAVRFRELSHDKMGIQIKTILLVSLFLAQSANAGAWMNEATSSAPFGRSDEVSGVQGRYFVFPDSESIDWDVLRSQTGLEYSEINKLRDILLSSEESRVRLVFYNDPPLTHAEFLADRAAANSTHLRSGEIPLVVSPKMTSAALAREIQRVADLREGLPAILDQQLFALKTKKFRKLIVDFILEARGYNAALIPHNSDVESTLKLFEEFWQNYGFAANLQISVSSPNIAKTFFEVFGRYTLKKIDTPFYRAVLKNLKRQPVRSFDEVDCDGLLFNNVKDEGPRPLKE